MSVSKLTGALAIAKSRSVETPSSTATLSLDSITDRVDGDTRPLNPAHIEALADSIAVVGLIAPIAVDSRGRLLAGGHRRAAIALLREQDPGAFAKQFPSGQVPIRRYDFDSETEPGEALAIEATENEKRRDYTPAEVRAIADRLRAAGYRDAPGKPKKGEKALRPALELIIGKSIRQVRRYLNDAPDAYAENGEQNQDNQTRTDVLVLNRALVGLQKWAILANEYDEPGTAVKGLQGRVKRMMRDIEKAIAELEVL
ncbi:MULTISPECIES: ParB N-terminal domain-containing protein [Trichocoleus]|uniref:ParB N-terminal domain-containing protein n=1 Tax=Trichocoleus desertorum GB2-A4 TaxID=2933944 RepID=A0ABV0JDV0_9CYAN|nr:ParB N-terminal domain-containing protein [Trichocoleus sp. FACHB-46]MBD1865149.1 ParB N-terminal domain-containing protein [Trichocoleus sp. FACHB-46]